VPAEITGSRFTGGQVSIRPLFVCDGSPEVRAWLSALRARGYDVFQVPLGLLFNRVAVQKPAVVLLDVDQRSALTVAQRLRDLPGTRDIHLVFVGSAGRTIKSPSDAAFYEASAFLPRPVDVSELLRQAEALVGKPEARSRSSGASSPPSLPLGLSMRPPTLTMMPDVGPTSSSQLTRSSSNPASIESIQIRGAVLSIGSIRAPTLDLSIAPSAPSIEASDGWAPGASIARHLSVELQQMLREAEERWGGVPPAPPPSIGYSPQLTPEEEVSGVLPPDVLRALEEPLEPMEEDADDNGEGLDEEEEAGRDSEAPSARGSGESEPPHDNSESIPPQLEDAFPPGLPGAITAAPPIRRDSPVPNSAQSLWHEEGRAPEASRRPTPVPPRRPTPPPASGGTDQSSVKTSLLSASDMGDQRTLATVPPPQPPAGTVRQRVPPSDPPVAPHHTEHSQPPPVTDPSADVDDAIRAARPTTAPPSRRRESDRSGGTGTEGLRVPAQMPRPAPVPRDLSPNQPQPLPQIPQVLSSGDALRAIAHCVTARYSGCLAIEFNEGVRRVVFREGDFVTAVSAVDGESLLAFLRQRGELAVEVIKLERRLPPYGRHAGAALVAHGHLRQEELWPALRSHAEWVLGRCLQLRQGSAGLEEDLPARLQGEPGVFGGATGAEVLVEIARRVISPEESLARLGGPGSRLTGGLQFSLLSECALEDRETATLRDALDGSVGDALSKIAQGEFATVLYVLRELGIVDTVRSVERAALAEPAVLEAARAIDDDAIRARIAARRSLVTDGDYFSLLGLAPQATGYEIRRAYLQLRKEYEPSHLLTARTADLRDDLELILEILDEAYEILHDDARRERYRIALSATIP
jgi:hypothetical protein